MPPLLRLAKPHQASTLVWARGRSLLGLYHDMRLGKSLTVLRWILSMCPPPESVLISAPLTVLPAWMDELSAEGQSVTLLQGSREERLALALAGAGRFYLTNKEALFEPGHQTSKGKPKPVPSELAMLEWGAVIIDESTCLRNPKAVLPRAAHIAFRDTPVKAVLSGLPNPKSSLDFFMQMLFLHGRFMGCRNFWQFRNKFFEPDRFGWRWEPKPGAEEQIRTALEKSCHFLTKEDVGLSNKKTFVRRYVNLPQKALAAYKELEREFAVGDYMTKWVVSVRSGISQLTGGRPETKELRKYEHNAKLDELIELLQGELEGEQVLVWFRYRRELAEAERRIRKAGFRVRGLHGSTPLSMRQSFASRFRAKELDVLCLQQQTGRFGINLATASTAIFFSWTEDPEDWSQSLDRIEHMMKKRGLLYIMLLARGTLDEDRFETLKTYRGSSRGFMKAMYRRFQARVKKERAK